MEFRRQECQGFKILMVVIKETYNDCWIKKEKFHFMEAKSNPKLEAVHPSRRTISSVQETGSFVLTVQLRSA